MKSPSDNSGKHDAFQELRRRAEQIVGQRADSDPDIAVDSEEFLRLLHEIEVYQVEVELQNEELQSKALELRHSRDEYHDLFDTAPVGFLVLDSNWRISRTNAAAAKLLAEETAWLRGKFLTDWIYRADQRTFFALLWRMAKTQSTEEAVELRLQGGDGLLRPAHLEVRALQTVTGRPREYRIALLDISARRRAEEELKALNEELERRVAERSRMAETRALQLRQLAMKLSEAENRERSRLATVLHDDLQQYLAAIRMRLQIKGSGATGGANNPDLLRLIDKSIQRCRSLSYELSPPVLNQSGLLPALQWLAEDMRSKYGLQVHLVCRPEAEPGSRDLAHVLFRCVKELLFNTVKHAGVEEATVEADNADGLIRLRVADQGKGCDLSRIDSAEGELHGFGLFSIRERIEFIGGRFAMDSAPGRGCSVTLEVPKDDSEQVEPAAIEEQAADVEQGEPGPRVTEKGITILIADDHLVMRQGLATLLEDEDDLEVVGQAADGGEAVRLTQELVPDVVLMDVAMPEMDGIEATAAIRRHTAHTRIIGLSMHDDEETEQQMLAAGAAAYLFKAAPARVLVETIRRLVHDDAG